MSARVSRQKRVRSVKSLPDGQKGASGLEAGPVRSSKGLALQLPTPPAQRGPQRLTRAPRSSGKIGIVSMGVQVSTLCRRPLMPEMLQAIEAEAAAHDLKVGLTSIGEDNQIPRSILGGEFDGLLLINACETLQRGVIDTLLQYPGVWMLSHHNDDRFEFDRLTCNNETVAWLATQYLIERGHKHVAFVNSTPSHRAFQLRRQVFAGHARSSGLKLSEYIAPLNGSVQPDILNHDLLMAALCESPDRPTGIFVPTDMQLPATYAVLQRYNLRPGKDVDVIGVDCMPAILSTLSPRPASIDINLKLVGCRAVRQLLWRRENMDEPNRMNIVVEPRLVVPAAGPQVSGPLVHHQTLSSSFAL